MNRRFRVLATNPVDPIARTILGPGCELVIAENDRPETLRGAVADADALIVRVRLPDDIFDHAPQLKACVRHGVGLDFIPVAAATRAGIPVANVPDANTQGVVEHVLAVILAMARRLDALSLGLKAGDWAVRNRFLGMEVKGKVLGVVGFGRIGRGVADTMRAGFGMDVIVSTSRPLELPPYAKAASLDDVFRHADIVALHVPASPSTVGMVDARRLALMKPESLLVNAARGNLVVDEALVEALLAGRPLAAALDVFEPEPLAPEHIFRTAPNLLLTPHSAALTAESLTRMSQQSAEAVIKILNKTQPDNLINPEIWDAYVKH